MSDTDEKQWYEKPIEVAPVEIDSSGSWISRRSVRNGVLGGNFFPERHLWKNEAEQREDVAELQLLAYQIEGEHLLDEFYGRVLDGTLGFSLDNGVVKMSYLLMPEKAADEEADLDGS